MPSPHSDASSASSNSANSAQSVSILGSRHWYDFVQPCLDSASILASLVLVKFAARGHVDDASFAMGLIAVIVFFLSSQLTGLQRGDRRGCTDSEIIRVLATWTLTILVLSVLAFATRYGPYFSRSVILSWCVLCPAMIGLTRMCLRIVQVGLLHRGVGTRRVAIAGCNTLGHQTQTNIESDSSLGLQFAGFYDDRNLSRDANAADETVSVDNSSKQASTATVAASTLQGDLNDLIAAARSGEVETVLVTLPMRAEKRIRFLLDELSDSTASVYIVPDFFVFELLHARWTQVGGLPAVSVTESPMFGIDGVAKRAADLILATAGLLAISVPMLIIAAAVKLTSPGPVFFRQRRYGLDGQEIRVWKFRSMTTCDDGAVVKQATANDSRITPLGAILRKTSLDELPQLFNVIEGSMSLVGPRPHASAHNEQYRGLIRGYMMRHKVKPGITGLAQVNGCRGETETVDKMEQRIHFDHQYIRSWSLLLDIRILFRTLLVVWKQPEAY
ncbi:capsular polysaccharide biosynthesis glycosyltransferase [Rhodopirellula islandica]|uniref:Capsular polysaccharide biosynthesis glycosyltransferase n=1 Tax=Rhodopirellula islandica TaxID=595434 RepID=A0A0J1BBA4_RHOIS|nr:undecaprenyl-phosphate glucose phosphotransferase [Rhodopirellula islandica]KLU03910.1 capsular polysaccharide biosynthesis glycosyltransferase [Rhodopirellula islandica]